MSESNFNFYSSPLKVADHPKKPDGIVPLATIYCITYNHVNFIHDTLKGFLMQETTFPVELVIGEDCSTDGTREIVFDYAERYPNVIRLITSETNVGMTTNGIRTLQAANGKYLAACEGDDYWTDPLKLQKQVGFLEANPDYVQVYHNTLEIFEDGEKESYLYCKPNQAEQTTTIDLLQNGNMIPTCSHVFIKHAAETPKWLADIGMGDWPINILLSKRGKVRYINEVMGVHRWHSGGIWSANSSVKNNLMIVEAYHAFLKNMDLTPGETEICKKRINAISNTIYLDLLLQKKKKAAVNFLGKRIARNPMYLFKIGLLKDIKYFITK